MLEVRVDLLNSLGRVLGEGDLAMLCPELTRSTFGLEGDGGPGLIGGEIKDSSRLCFFNTDGGGLSSFGASPLVSMLRAEGRKVLGPMPLRLFGSDMMSEKAGV